METNVYRRLSTFQGQYIPKFYGRYRYSAASDKDATAILLEKIPGYSLNNFHRLPESELLEILKIGNTALDAIHSKGIYHYDIQESNLFWGQDKTLRIIDWEFSRLDPPAEVARHWAASDRAELRRILTYVGRRRLGN